MHVLIIPSEHFVTPRYPLGGIFQFQQAKALHDAGYQVGLIAVGIITPRFFFRKYDYPYFEDVNGYPVFRRYVRKFYPQRWERPARSIPFYKNLGLDLYQKYKERFGVPDVIHAHNVQFAGFVAQAIQESEGVPYIVTEHSSKFRTGLIAREWFSPIKKVFQQASALTAVSQALANNIDRHCGGQCADVLYNIVDSFLLDSPLKDRSSLGSGFCFLNIASLDANKDQYSLLTAFAKHFKGKQVSLRIGGSGPLERHLKRLAQRLGVQGQVIFLGYLDRPSVLREMQEADCFVLSSRQETFGVVLIEALACGTPVIATRCGGPEEIVNNKNGLLVLPRDPVALGEAMVRMVAGSSQYSPEALRSGCRVHFGEKAFIANVGRYYNKAVSLA